MVMLFSYQASSLPGTPDSTAIREGLETIFGDSITVSISTTVMTEAEMKTVRDRSKSPLHNDTLRIFTCRAGDTVLGHGIVDEVMGKSRFITYMVGVLPSGAVAGIEILVYRESHGGEIAAEAFRRQFSGKKPGDRLIPGRDVKIISGATISSRAITYGVAKVVTAFGLVRERISK
jgi:Na+-translocating ferredoxin:NAD+ oxidoreductase RnfG subunit